MPNYVKVDVTASEKVISGMINIDGDVDFNMIKKFKGFFPYNSVSTHTVRVAEGIIKNYEKERIWDVVEFEASQNNISDEELEVLKVMLRNYEKIGYLHDMDFAIGEWGTKWNASETIYDDSEPTNVRFDTAWSVPEPYFKALSKKFPDEEIHVKFADEDIGCNCGTCVFKGGKIISEEFVNNPHKEQSPKTYKEWYYFACEVWGYDADSRWEEIHGEEEEEDEDEK